MTVLLLPFLCYMFEDSEEFFIYFKIFNEHTNEFAKRTFFTSFVPLGGAAITSVKKIWKVVKLIQENHKTDDNLINKTLKINKQTKTI